MTEPTAEPAQPKRRFPIAPAHIGSGPPLTAEGRRFVLLCATTAGAGELLAWAGATWLARSGPARAGLVAAASALAIHALLRGPLSRLATRVSRRWLATLPLAAAALAMLAGALLARDGSLGRALMLAQLCGLAPLGLLAAGAAADNVDLEKRPRSFGMLDMGQALGAAAGLTLGASPRWYGLAGAGALGLAALPAAWALARVPAGGCPSAFTLGQTRLAAAQRKFAPGLVALAAGGLALGAVLGQPGPAAAWWALALALLAGMRLGAGGVDRFGEVRALVACAALLALAAAVPTFAPAAVGAILAYAAAGALLSSLAAAPAGLSAEMLRAPASAAALGALGLGAAASLALRAWLAAR